VLALERDSQPTADDETALRQHLASVSGTAAAHVHSLLAALTCRDRAAESRRHATAAAQEIDPAADNDLAPHLAGLYWLARAESVLGDLDAALEHCERGLRMTEARGLNGLVPRFAAALSSLQRRAGDALGAVRHAACAQAAAARTGTDQPALWPALDAPTGDVTQRTQRHEADHQLDSLSGRELQTALLVSAGHTNDQIARKLDLSHKTVETYLARIFKKLDVTCRAEVATIVGRSGR
jgi:DNA-binding CsgD family transcriptional regulator